MCRGIGLLKTQPKNQMLGIISNKLLIQTLQLTSDFHVFDLICSSHQPNEADVVYPHFTDQETEAQRP